MKHISNKTEARSEQFDNSTIRQFESFFSHTRYLFMLAILLSSILFSGQSFGQFLAPSMSPVSYPSTSSSIYLDNLRTTYISNYSTDITSHTSSGIGIDIVGWSYDEGGTGVPTGGGFTAGTHILSPVSSPFVGDATFAIPNAVDVRVGYMDPYIVVAFYDKSRSNYYFQYYNWAVGSGIITYVAEYPLFTFNPTVPQYNRISMDINQDGTKAAVLFSDGNHIFGAGLVLTGPVFTTTPPPGPPFAIALDFFVSGPSTGNELPDVAFNRDYVPMIPEDYIFYAYHNSTVEIVCSYKFNDLISPSPPATVVPYEFYAIPSGTRVNFDCPDHFAFGHWAYTYSDGNNIYLRADTLNLTLPLPYSSAYTTIINDGSINLAATDISMYGNLAPTLCYKHSLPYDDIYVVWATLALPHFTYIPNQYSPSYVSQAIRVNGPIAPSSSDLIYDYRIIDNTLTNKYVTGRPLIALDRNAKKGNRLVSYLTENSTGSVDTLQHKNVEYFNYYYRYGTGIATVGEAKYTKLYPNPFSNSIKLELPTTLQNEVWTIRVSDLLGRSVAYYCGKAPSDFVSQASASWQGGQYIVKIENANTEPQITKITKQ